MGLQRGRRRKERQERAHEQHLEPRAEERDENNRKALGEHDQLKARKPSVKLLIDPAVADERLRLVEPLAELHEAERQHERQPEDIHPGAHAVKSKVSAPHGVKALDAQVGVKVEPPVRHL
eukprot:Amastigsp_a843107_20.p5 type:complete len:121 gc:universal Amastigsp_a843107_20:533-895(+)